MSLWDKQTSLTEPAGGEAEGASSPGGLSLTDFLDTASLQEIQDSFTAVTRLCTSIQDADGQRVTEPTDALDRAQSDQWLEHLITPEPDEVGRFSAPIVVEGQALGSITIERAWLSTDATENRRRFREAAEQLGLSEADIETLTEAAEESFSPNRAASIQFLYLLANSIARLCYEQYHARQRIEELQALYRVSTLLSGHRDVQYVLQTASESIGEVMNARATVIRLLERDRDNELVAKAMWNLSEDYLKKVSIRLEESEIFSQALEGEVVYVEDMSTDGRVIFPDDARHEGLVSMLCAGMRYQGRPIGVVQVFSGEVRQFTRFERHLLSALAHVLASTIQNARLEQARSDNQRMMRQLHLAADVQRRMLPSKMPKRPPLELAARYVPSYELGGDFYDFLDLDGHLGVAIGDVVGKGVAASLLMASVRASLRAYAQDLYDLDEIIARVNKALCRDTSDNEFATLWYGVFDPATLRLTYCNAGHEPPLLLRNGRIRWLDAGGMIVGVDPAQTYGRGLIDLKPDDLVLLYSDGLVEAFNDEGEQFGRARVEQALKEAADEPAAEALNHVLWSMRRFTGKRRSRDDNTLVMVKVGREGARA